MLDTLDKQVLFGGAHFAAATHVCPALCFEPGNLTGPELTCSALERDWRALLPQPDTSKPVITLPNGCRLLVI